MKEVSFNYKTSNIIIHEEEKSNKKWDKNFSNAWEIFF